MISKRPVFMALGLLALIATPVLAAGLWPNLPLVGGAAFCSSTNQAGISGTAPVCTTTTPAGPAGVTGLETVPADTNRTGGAAPQTVRMSMASFNALPLTYSTQVPTASTLTTTTGALDGGIVFLGSSTLTPTLALVLPSSPVDGQQFRISGNQSLTLTVNAVGATVSNAPTVMTVSTTGPFGYLYRYRASNTNWYRLQ